MRRYYESLNEKDRRRYAGIEALKLGHGGQNYIAKVLGCSRRTVRKGAIEVSGLPGHIVAKQIGKSPAESSEIRKKGGGRKQYLTEHPEIDEQFLNVVREHTAGDPMDEKVRWTNLREWEIAEALEKKYGVKVSRNIVRQLLKKHDYRLRKAQKRKPMKKNVPDRDAQFDNILKLRSEYRKAGNPVISMDTKKKEYLGNFYRKGRLYTLEELQVFDHDFTSFAEGVIIPHCFYDLRLNIGYVQVGTSHDTSEFACDSFRHWWYGYGCRIYPNATSVLILCDGGGSNSSRHYLFKQDLQILADEIGIEIRIAHYPPYCSKFNPIEHRLFPHITRACQGVIFSSLEVVTDLIAKTHTKKGLKVFVHVIDKVYETGRKVAETFKSEMRIVFDKILPKWNYRAIPIN
ncbi:Transposase DDE domain-containing protein [Desulfonema magnum]|nr:Transposase family protein, DDE domain-containing [Desulfonema magnum]QTA91778.1 Transposase DDE domain-containing protein [Desulfonema magnum]